MIMKIIKILMVLIFYTVVFTGLGFAQEADKKVYKVPVDTRGIQRVNILGGGYFFDPNYIIVKVNMPVEFIVKKEPGITPHTIVIKAPEAGIEVKESLETEPKVIRFTPKKSGKFPFYCDKGLPLTKSHRERGMEGILEVTE